MPEATMNAPKVPILQQLEPSVVELGGKQWRLFFSMRAAMRMEEAFHTDYLSVVMEAIQAKDDPDAPMPPPMALEKQVKLISILLEEGGTPATEEELAALHMSELNALFGEAINELIFKSPHSSSKKK